MLGLKFGYSTNGKGIVEFKKGLAGIEEDVTQPSRQPTIGRNDRAALPSPCAAYKFDPYTGEPVQESDGANPDD